MNLDTVAESKNERVMKRSNDFIAGVSQGGYAGWQDYCPNQDALHLRIAGDNSRHSRKIKLLEMNEFMFGY